MAKKDATSNEVGKTAFIRQEIDNVGKKLKELYSLTGFDDDGKKAR